MMTGRNMSGRHCDFCWNSTTCLAYLLTDSILKPFVFFQKEFFFQWSFKLFASYDILVPATENVGLKYCELMFTLRIQ